MFTGKLPTISREQLALESLAYKTILISSSPSLAAQSLLPTDIWTQISRLHRFIEEYPFPETTSKDDPTEKHSDHRKDYESALKFYENSTRQIELAGPHVEAGMAFLWAYPLSKQFHEDLQARKPAALVLLAHYCVLLQAVDHKWYLNGMAWQLLEDIERNIHPGYQDWLVWPKRWVYRR